VLHKGAIGFTKGGKKYRLPIFTKVGGSAKREGIGGKSGRARLGLKKKENCLTPAVKKEKSLRFAIMVQGVILHRERAREESGGDKRGSAHRSMTRWKGKSERKGGGRHEDYEGKRGKGELIPLKICGSLCISKEKFL